MPKTYQVEGGYLPPHKFTQDWLADMQAAQRSNPKMFKGNPVTSWWGQPRYKEVPAEDVIF